MQKSVLAVNLIKHPISGQSTNVVKGFMFIKFDIVDTAFSIGRALTVC